MTDELFPHLRNAPATEAVVEIRTQPREAVEGAALRSMAREGFTVEEMHWFESEITIEAARPKIRHQETLGYRFVGGDGRVVVQATIDRIATSRLQPYTDWDDLIATAKDFWASYVHVARPAGVVRLGVRYINLLELPSGPRDLGQFLVDPPQVFAGMIGGLSGYLKRVVTTDDASVATIVTQMVRDSTERRSAVILDIDCAITKWFATSDNSIWDRFSDLRTRKNLVFFGNITGRARSMYE